MSTSSSSRDHSRKAPPQDRRADPTARGATASLRKVKGALNRPIGLERRDDKLHLVLVERRRAPRVVQPPSPSQLRAELRARLLAQEHADAAQVMRHLAVVHDQLGRKGWTGVEALPARVMGLALVQAEVLASSEPSPLMSFFIEQLRAVKVAAEIREERKQRLQEIERSVIPQVSDSTLEEFDATERSWVGAPLTESPPLEHEG